MLRVLATRKMPPSEISDRKRMLYLKVKRVANFVPLCDVLLLEIILPLERFSVALGRYFDQMNRVNYVVQNRIV